MELIVIAGSNNSRKVLAVAGHLGLALAVRYLSFPDAEHKSPAYLTLNPNGKVPTLVDGDFVLWESNAIIRYLCAKAGETSLYPSDRQQRADIDRWLSWELAHFNNHFGALSWETVAKPMFLNQSPDPVLAAAHEEKLNAYARILDAHLQGRTYAVGDSITLADYALIHIEQFKNLVAFDWSPFPALNRYFDHMRATPHWAATAVAPDKIGRKPD